MTRPAPLKEVVALVLKEGRRRVVVLAAIFASVAMAALAYGALKPKEYEAHSVILVESKNIITPLMEGRAVATAVTDQAAIASQAMGSHRILRELLAFGGWDEPADARDEERMMNRLSSRIRIARQRPELIRVAYVDTDPQRCLDMTKKIAEVFIRESLFGKSRQSSDAFAFIDRQVTEYAAKVADAHAAVQGYYRAHGEPKRGAGPKPPASAGARASAPGLRPEEVAALRAQEAALAAEVESGQQTRQRRAERLDRLQRELDSLLGAYTEKHPNVVRAREELQSARAEAARANAAEEPAARSARARLEEVRGRLAAAGSAGTAPIPGVATQTASGVIQFSPGLLPPSPGEILAAQDSTLAELLRQYESARDVYQDLLRRRENARVSLELDAEQRGLTVRVYEEPELPALPIGMRLMHVTLVGLVLALAAPLGLLFAFVRFDPRVRTAQQIERTALVPILVTIPYASTSDERARERRRVALAAAVVCGVFATYAVFLAVRLGIVDAALHLLHR